MAGAVTRPHPLRAMEVPGFEIERELGAGGGGRVFLARALGGGALPKNVRVALKVPSATGAEREQQVAALRREAAIAARCTHPALVRVRAFDGEADPPWLALDFVPGPTLADLVARGEPITEPRVREVGGALAAALATLHAAGLAHGDVKPENVRLDDRGHAVLLDLGLAREHGDDDGTRGGTLAWIAPEVLAGGPSSPAGDVFALGAVLYLLATGRHPFGAEGAEASELLVKIASARVVPPSRRVPELSPLLDALLDGCLRRDPTERPDAGTVAAALDEGEAGAWWRARVATALGAEVGGGALRAEAHALHFVGRREELRRLRADYDAVLASVATRVFALHGPVGSGKTRLVSDFVETLRAGEAPCLFLHARCSDLTESHRYGTPVRLLERWLQLPPHRPLGPREVGLLERLVPPRDADALRRALEGGADSPTPGRAAVGLAAWLAALAAERPVVVLIDDLHRAGAATLDVLVRIVESAPRARLLLVFAWDDDQVPTDRAELTRLIDHARRLDGERVSLTELALGPLSEDDVSELVTHHFHHAAPRLRIGRVLFDRSRGNPGLLAELLVGLVERREAELIDGPGSRLRLAIAPDAIRLPGSLRASMRARYRELDPLARRWLERLSVVGGRLETGFLCRAFAPADPAEVDRTLDELTRRGWLVPVSSRFRFARGALREAVYRSLDDDRRVRLHRMAARALEGETGDRDAAFQRAYHLRAAGEHHALVAAVEALLPAPGRRAAPHRLLRLARWGLEALEALGRPEAERPREVRLLEFALDAADRLGERELQRGWLDRLADLVTDVDRDPRAAATVYLLHGRHAVATGEFGTARAMLKNAFEFAERADDARLQGEALRGWALVEAEFASTASARALAARALDAADDPEALAQAHLVSARIEVLDDRLERALDDVRAALAELRAADLDSPSVAAGAYVMRARVWRAAGRVRRALGAARRARALAREAGDRRREAETTARIGWLLLDLDRPEEAEAELREARLLAAEIEDPRAGVLADLWLGLLLYEHEDDGARATIQGALVRAEEIGFHRAEAVGRAIQARVHLLDGRRPRAQEEADRAWALLERHGLELVDRIVVAGTCALLLQDDGRPGEARDVLRELRRRIRRTARRIRRPDLRRALATYATALLDAVLTLDGPVYPRTPDTPPPPAARRARSRA